MGFKNACKFRTRKLTSLVSIEYFRSPILFKRLQQRFGADKIKKLRFQAGWAKCEKTRGVYDFAWIDAVVADAAATP